MNSLDPSKSINISNSANTLPLQNTTPNTMSAAINNTPTNSSIFQNSSFKIIMLLLILAFLGFNIFKYLAEGTDIITTLLSSL